MKYDVSLHFDPLSLLRLLCMSFYKSQVHLASSCCYVVSDSVAFDSSA